MKKEKVQTHVAKVIISISTQLALNSVGKSPCMFIHEVPIPNEVRDFCKNQNK